MLKILNEKEKVFTKGTTISKKKAEKEAQILAASIGIFNY